MDTVSSLQSLVNQDMFPEPIRISEGGIVSSVQVIDTAMNAIQTMDVLLANVVINGVSQKLCIGMPAAGPKTIYGEVTMGVALREHPSLPGYCFYNSQNDYQVAIKRSSTEELFRRVRGGATNEENPLNEIAIMEHMQRQAESAGYEFGTLFPHNMPLDLVVSDGESLFTVLPRMKNCMEMFDYCFANAATKAARSRLSFRSRIEEAKMIMRAILRSVCALHAQHIAHRDLSLENVLISVTCLDGSTLHIEDVKVIDYGMAVYHPPAPVATRKRNAARFATYEEVCVVEEEEEEEEEEEQQQQDSDLFFDFDEEDGDNESLTDGATTVDAASTQPPSASADASAAAQKYTTPFYGKRTYVPPECFYQRHAETLDPRAADIWACGIMLFALCFDQMLFESANHVTDKLRRFPILHSDPVDGLRRLLHAILPRATCLAEPLLIDLLVEMLRMDPTQRLTADEVLAHPWFHASDMPIAA